VAHAAATMKRNDTALYEALVGRVVEDTMFRNLTSQGFANLVWSLGKARFHNATAQTALVQRLTEKLLADDSDRVIQVHPRPPPLRARTHAARCCAPPWQGARLPLPATPRPRLSAPQGRQSAARPRPPPRPGGSHVQKSARPPPPDVSS